MLGGGGSGNSSNGNSTSSGTEVRLAGALNLSAPLPVAASIIAYSSRFGQLGASSQQLAGVMKNVPLGLQGSVFAQSDGGKAFRRERKASNTTASTTSTPRTDDSLYNPRTLTTKIKSTADKSIDVARMNQHTLPFSAFLRPPRRVSNGEYGKHLGNKAVHAMAADEVSRLALEFRCFATPLSIIICAHNHHAHIDPCVS